MNKHKYNVICIYKNGRNKGKEYFAVKNLTAN